MRSLLAQREAQKVSVIESLQRARQTYLCPTATCAVNEESKARAHVTKYVARTLLETHTQGT